MTDRFLEALRDIVGGAHVLLEADAAPYERDWTGHFTGSARAVVRPRSEAEVAEVALLCSAQGVAIVPQGGNTGLVGGAVPPEGSIVLNLTRSDFVAEVDPETRTVTVAAGATLADVHAAALRAGSSFAVDHAARDSATVGGAVATDAGGSHAWRYGKMREHVAGVRAVTTTGKVIEDLEDVSDIEESVADTFDLTSLLCGSEGTLAVVTGARLRLRPRVEGRTTALLAVDSIDAAVAVFARLRERCPSLEAVEFFRREGLALVCAHTGLPQPFGRGHDTYLLCEAIGPDAEAELPAAVGAVSVEDVAVAQDEAQRDRLWAYRERHNEAVTAHRAAKFDVAVPLDRIASFLEGLPNIVERHASGAHVVVFGHLGNGNLHVNVLDAPPERLSLEDAIYNVVAQLGGNPAAEHGIGRAKTRWLSLARSETEIEKMRAMKRALDPDGLLNPGVLFPQTETSG